MAGAIRRISVEHGRDPRDFVLFSYGGGGPLHASALARELAIPTVVVSRPSRAISRRLGMLLADARLDDVADLRRPARRADHRRDATRPSRRWNASSGDALRREFGAERDRLRALRRDALSRPAPQHQGADLPASPTRPRFARLRARLPAPLRSCRRAAPARVPGAAPLGFRAHRAVRRSRGCRARGGDASARGDAPGLFRPRGRHARNAQSTTATRSPRALRRRARRSRRIRLDHGRLAGRPVRRSARFTKSGIALSN